MVRMIGFFLFMGITEANADLLKNLEKHLEIAEHTPGQAGVDQVRYYETQIKKAKMKNAPVVKNENEKALIEDLQERLQILYARIYALKKKACETASGIELKKLGMEINAKEKEELSFKSRLRAMGINPLSPRILTQSEEFPELTFQGEIQKQMTFIQKKINDLQQKIATAQCGEEIIQLGEKMNQLQYQLHLLTASLPAEKLPIAAQSLTPLLPSKKQIIIEQQGSTENSTPLWDAKSMPESTPIEPSSIKAQQHVATHLNLWKD